MPSTPDPWLLRYRRIRELTDSLTAEDPRYKTIWALLQQCDTHYATRNDTAFIAVGKQIATLMSLPGSQHTPSAPAHATDAV
jgi:hypothetical protein